MSRRKQSLTNRKYHLKFAIRILGVVFIIAIFSGVMAIGMLWQNLYQPDSSYESHFFVACIGVVLFLFIELILAIPLVYLLTIKQSNELIGPVNRIVTTLQQISNGDFSAQMSIRKGEPLEEIGNAVNILSKEMQNSFPHLENPTSPKHPSL